MGNGEPVDPALDDAAAEAVLSGDVSSADLAALAAAVQVLREVMPARVPASPELAAQMATGFTDANEP